MVCYFHDTCSTLPLLALSGLYPRNYETYYQIRCFRADLGCSHFTHSFSAYRQLHSYSLLLTRARNRVWHPVKWTELSARILLTMKPLKRHYNRIFLFRYIDFPQPARFSPAAFLGFLTMQQRRETKFWIMKWLSVRTTVFDTVIAKHKRLHITSLPTTALCYVNHVQHRPTVGQCNTPPFPTCLSLHQLSKTLLSTTDCKNVRRIVQILKGRLEWATFVLSPLQIRNSYTLPPLRVQAPRNSAVKSTSSGTCVFISFKLSSKCWTRIVSTKAKYCSTSWFRPASESSFLWLAGKCHFVHHWHKGNVPTWGAGTSFHGK